MNEERFRQIEELYHAAREDRAVLDQADPELRGKVEALLAQDASGGKILDRPAWEAAGDRPLTPGAQIGPYKIADGRRILDFHSTLGHPRRPHLRLDHGLVGR